VRAWFDAGALDAIAEPGSKGFAWGDAPGAAFFVVRKAGQVFAYRNRCPHTGAPLEWQPDQFLDMDNSFIQCALHGALFRAQDGFCLRGPCAGQSLQPLRVEVVDGRVRVDITPLSPPPETDDAGAAG
jgi:nitrite reductase/ring-hydroxylating ferredoxin subunit